MYIKIYELVIWLSNSVTLEIINTIVALIYLW